MAKYTDIRKQAVFKAGTPVSLVINTTPIVGGTPGDVLIVGPTNEVAELPIDTTPTNGSANLIDSNAVYDGLATKQDTLVSGTNIKTINTTSLLGSGDIAVQATLVSGTNIKSINGSSILGSGDYKLPTSIQLAASDETTALTAGTNKVTFRMPYAMIVTGVRASLTTAQASGNIFTVDINESGVSILSTKLTIDNTEKTSVTAAIPPVISDANLADDAEITIDIDQIGDGTAKGLKITLIGTYA